MKKSKIIVIIGVVLALTLLLLPVFTIASSVYYTNKVTEIIESASYSYGKDYEKYSDYISEEDYKEFCMLDEGEPKENYLCKGSVIIFPHHYFSGTNQEYSLYSKSKNMDYWICLNFKFDIEFNWFDFQIKNVESYGGGDGFTTADVIK